MNSMDKTREFLKTIGLPGGDAYDLPESKKRFKDNGQYRFEVPGIQGPKVMRALLEAMDSYGLYLHRVTQTQGIMRLTDEEIERMVELAHKWETDLILAIGPRATTDTSASVHTEEGVRMGYRLRGQEQIVRAVEDVKRAAGIGCRGFLVYDEGCLWERQGRSPRTVILRYRLMPAMVTRHRRRCWRTLVLIPSIQFVIYSSKCWRQCARQWTARLTFILKIRSPRVGLSVTMRCRI